MVQIQQQIGAEILYIGKLPRQTIEIVQEENRRREDADIDRVADDTVKKLS